MPNHTKPKQTKPNTKAWAKGPKLDSFRFGTARLNLFKSIAEVHHPTKPSYHMTLIQTFRALPNDLGQ